MSPPRLHCARALSRRTPVALLLALLCAAPAWSAEVGDSVEMTPDGSKAAKRGLAYLAGTQRSDGSWPGGYGGTSGIVAACSLAFMGGGHLPDRGEHGQHVARSLQFLVRTAQPNGLLYREGMQGAPMYHHGLATLALAEAWGITQDKKLRDVVKRAADLIVATQNQRGGWRYQPRVADDDLSATVMQLMALRAAKDGGIFVPQEVIDLGIQYVKTCHNPKEAGKDGGFAYQPNGESGFARTGAGILSLQVAGNYRAGEVIQGVDYLLQFKPVGSREPEREHYSYGHYYAAMGIYQSQSVGSWGRKAWASWYPAVTREMVSTQKPDGHWEGSYDQYPTAVACLVLEIPYRFLPIYQR